MLGIQRIGRIGVVGAGTMGHGIAQVCAMNGFDVLLYDIDEENLRMALEKISASLNKFNQKGSLKETQEEILSRLTATANMNDFADADLVIEAVPENIELKKDIFRQLDKICKPEAILATNTSSIPIGKIARATRRPEQVIGMHFMNPPVLVPLIEIIPASRTSGVVLQSIKILSQVLGRTPIVNVLLDVPGFIVNRALQLVINDTAESVERGLGSAEDINKATVHGAGGTNAMGPLELADLIGIDVCVDILNVMWTAGEGEKFKPCALLKKMAAEGHLGRKSGKGFFDYTPKEEKPK